MELKIRKILKEKNISQFNLAIETDINQCYLSKALNERIEFREAWRKKIAKHLQMDEDEVFPEYKGEAKNGN
jgi:transcriptional regulator with XRE-family HTH domain